MTFARRLFVMAIQCIRCGRAVLFAFVTLASAVSAHAKTAIHSLTKVIEHHSVGGVTVDLLGNIYVADFGEVVWKISLNGERRVFATGLYGASGNAIDDAGNLLQSSFYGNSITRIDRNGQATPWVTRGLSGPVGLAVDRHTGDVYVANCRGNSIARLTPDGAISPFATSEHFKCPNGIAFDGGGNLYVVNFRDNKMLKIDPKGAVELFATISDKGLGHLCFKDNRFYVAASQSNAIFEVRLDGTATRILGNGERGIVDGASAKARMSLPNGIGCHPWTHRLYINEFVGDPASLWPPRAIIREIILDTPSP
jgi:DNA-binding beta-propeller fold protein YncE